MSLPRRKTSILTPTSERSNGLSEDGLSVEVMVTTACILFGKRYAQWDRLMIPKHRAEDLFVAGLTVTAEQVEAMWQSAGRILTPNLVPSQYHAVPYDPNALKVLQLTAYDPGSSVYRYHSAANCVPGVVSALVRHGHSNTHCDLRQWDTEVDDRSIRILAMTADVIHSHMDYYVLRNVIRESIGPWKNARTYHGSVDPQSPRWSIYVNHEGEDDKMDAVVFGARPYHHRFGVPHWLPIPMPVKDYQPLRQPSGSRTFRIAHSPTNRRIKGTNELIAAVEYLRYHVGLDIELVMIEGMSHGEALRVKGSCDAVFDSFWLGMQGSGLEGGAMGIPVLAGDPDAQNDLVKLDIPVPWTIANDGEGIRTMLARLISDRAFYEQEAARVHAYVKQYHDYPVVGAKYANILTEAVNGSADRI